MCSLAGTAYVVVRAVVYKRTLFCATSVSALAYR